MTFMLCTRNSGKYMTKTFEKEQSQCNLDKTGYSESEQSYYELTGALAGAREDFDETFLLDVITPDEEVKPGERDAVDIRKRPQCGD